MKDNDQEQINEVYQQLNEVGGGGFSGQGSPEDASWLGGETVDEVTEDDINGRLGEISSQLNTLDTWIADVREFGNADRDEVYEDINKLQQTINGFIMKYDVESGDQDLGRVERDDDYRGEDLPPRETDQDRYGYPGDR
tara:strand:- start:553 stop:969 length:417 start_codon:yes stop_codon:yes gene_type:complete